jgi:hypothetical protein
MVLWTAAALWTVPAEAKRPKACWVPTRMKYTGRDTIEYTTQPDAQQREIDAARIAQREPREVRAGWISLSVERLTLPAADPVHQLIIVEKDGAEVVRYEPPSEIPDINPAMYAFWFAYAVVQLPEGVAPPLQVTVVDRLLNTACVWSVEADGFPTLLPRNKTDEATPVTQNAD